MNKHIINALSKYDFTFEKNNGYGHIDGYEVNVINNPLATGPVFFFSTFLSAAKKNDFIIKLNEKKIKLVQSQAFDYGVAVLIGAITAGAFEKKLPEVLPQIIEILTELEAPKGDICPQSGEELTDEKAKVIPYLGIKVRMTNQAVETVNETVEQANENFEESPNNYLKGFGGILIGAVVGVIVTIVFALLGYVTALASFVSVALGVFLYKKFGGKQNYVMIVMSLLTTLIVILVALVGIYVIVANKAAIEAGSDLRGFKALVHCLEYSEQFKKTFYTDLGLNALFIFVGEALSIYSLVKMIKRPKKIN